MYMQRSMFEVNGTHGWIMLGVGVVAWELWGPELLSVAVDRALVRGGWRARGTQAMILMTALHLLNVLPQGIDPWHQAGKLHRRTRFGGGGKQSAPSLGSFIDPWPVSSIMSGQSG